MIQIEDVPISSCSCFSVSKWFSSSSSLSSRSASKSSMAMRCSSSFCKGESDHQ